MRLQENLYRYGLILLAVLAACGPGSDIPGVATPVAYDSSQDVLRFPSEVHLRNVRQLTFGGNNAEAYWSVDDKQLVFQSDWGQINPQGCDQQFVMNVDVSPLEGGEQYRLVSTGQGRTTCGYFLPDGRVVFASTHASKPECPPTVMFSGDRYVWPIYADYDIYISNPEGGDVQPLISGPGYDAEATLSPDGKYLAFTSTRSGDLELWRYELASGALLQLTDQLGYDGGAFFSRDSTQIVWRASRPEEESADSYRELLADNKVEPSALNIFVANIDGSDVRKVTDLPGANWAPFFHPDGERILFASNHHSLEQGGRMFDVFMIHSDGTGLEKITHSGTFDAFPMFSYDGTKLVFASNRNVDRTDSRDTNIFVADWVEEPEEVDRNFGLENH